MVSEKDIARFGGEIHKSADRLLTLINDTFDFRSWMQRRRMWFWRQWTVSGCRELHGYAGDECEKHDVTLKLEGVPCKIRTEREWQMKLFIICVTMPFVIIIRAEA